MNKKIGFIALSLAWLIALAGTFISLYYGEIVGIPPCWFCWFQRIFLFPLALILGIGLYKKDTRVVQYTLPLAFLGFIFALYQNLEPYFAFLQRASPCGETIKCTTDLFLVWKIFSFPLLSLIGFAAIIALLIVAAFTRPLA